jgi:CheY-like chemotaxis protein
MDVNMPVMDGAEAVRRLKATEAGAKTPIIALSASVLDHERDSIMEAGFDRFMYKPFKEDDIWSCLEEQLGIEFVREEVAEEETGPEEALTVESVSVLGHDLIGQLREALESADLDRISELLEGASDEHPQISSQLQEMAEAFDYEGLEALLAE